MHLYKPLLAEKHKKIIRVAYISLILVATLVSISAVSVLYTTQIALELSRYTQPLSEDNEPKYTPPPFPIGVHPAAKAITENPGVNTYLDSALSYTTQKDPIKNNWVGYTIAKLAQLDWYQNLASPTGRILVVRPGARREEVLKNFSKILHWDEEMKQTFTALVVSAAPAMEDGKFFPAHYLVGKNATPEEVADILTQRFNTEIRTRYPSDVERLVPMEDALIIASLLEIEAYDFIDMREISGVIWNRLFIGMNLQIDATLQYAKGTASETTWYPQVKPDDKYIDSPFNTYQNAGLPPAPIGNPSTAAVLAALNPVNTDCFFYFHDKDSQFHCTPTYEQHVDLLKQFYGRGK